MTPAAANYLRRSEAARAALGVLRWTGLTVVQLAYVLRDRFNERTLAGAVRILRIAGLVRCEGQRVAWPGRRLAKVWRAVQDG
jgi:hypothetical protein